MTLEQTALARLLQERREAAGYSRAKLGKIFGISAGTIEGWELGRVGRPPFHEVMRIASFLRIPFEDLQRAVFADSGTVPDAEELPGTPERKKAGRKKRLGAVPLLEAAFRLYGWRDETDGGRGAGNDARSGARMAPRHRAHGHRPVHGAHDDRQRCARRCGQVAQDEEHRTVRRRRSARRTARFLGSGPPTPAFERQDVVAPLPVPSRVLGGIVEHLVGELRQLVAGLLDEVG